MIVESEERISKLFEVLDIELPSSYRSRISVIFKDGDDTNWERTNIGYYFPEGAIECPFYPGFFYIPDFSRYVINKEGCIVRVRTGRPKKWVVTKKRSSTGRRGGYHVSWGYNDLGERKFLSRHRALLSTFQHPGHAIYDMVVNHKNGIGGDDRLDNLEFCTYSRNTQHAYDTGLHTTKVPIDAENWLTGEKYHFLSIADTFKALGLSETLVRHRLRIGSHRRHADGWRFKRSDVDWKELEDKISPTGSEVDVVCKNVFTAQEFVFGSIAEASRWTGVSHSQILRKLNLSHHVPFNGWMFCREDEYEAWPNYTVQHLEVFKCYPEKPKDVYTVYDLDTNVETFYPNREEAATHFGMSDITLMKLAKRNGILHKRYRFKIFQIRDVDSAPSGSDA